MKSFNLKFEYLHRDEGNYKIFGALIFRNPSKTLPLQATQMLTRKLIDGEYFYPLDVGIPLFEEHTRIGSDFSEWYEFHQFLSTKENPTDERTFIQFINGLKE